MKKLLSLIENQLDGAVEIRLFDKTKIIGQLGEYDDDGLTIIEKNTGKVSKFPFSQIKDVRPWASNKRFIVSLLIIAGFVGFARELCEKFLDSSKFKRRLSLLKKTHVEVWT